MMVVPLEDYAPKDGIYTHEFRISSEAFSWVSIKKAAYCLSGRCSFDFRSDGKEIICKILLPQPQPPKIVASIELAFRNELLDQDLRQHIAEETTPLRNAVLAFAFSKTGIQGPDEI
jgi:His-Xaa-Ser system protein HxsD